MYDNILYNFQNDFVYLLHVITNFHNVYTWNFLTICEKMLFCYFLVAWATLGIENSQTKKESDT